jgi:hypothetical protein
MPGAAGGQGCREHGPPVPWLTIQFDRDARLTAALLASALVLLWLLASAVSRGQGFLAFAGGAAGLGLAWVAFRRGRRSVLYGFWFVLLLATVTAAAFELLLRAWPGILKGAVANVAYTGYHWQRDGIYRLDPHRGPVMRPSFRRRMYWNGHWWSHETNADGYRGQRLVRADAVFLGDSMVYGHGVEADQAVPARFQARSGLRSANLGQQGACMVQQLLTFLETGVALRPRVVFVCTHPTDLEEVVRHYGAGELARFVSGPPQEGSPRPWVQPEFRPRPPWDPVAFWSLHVALPMESSGVLGAVARGMRGKGKVVVVRRDPFVPTPAERAMGLDGLVPPGLADRALPWHAHRYALGEISRACQRIGARLVLFDLGYPDALSAAVQATAGELGATYSDAGRTVVERSGRGEPMYLKDDGHWAPEGADAMAAALLESID